MPTRVSSRNGKCTNKYLFDYSFGDDVNCQEQPARTNMFARRMWTRTRARAREREDEKQLLLFYGNESPSSAPNIKARKFIFGYSNNNPDHDECKAVRLNHYNFYYYAHGFGSGLWCILITYIGIGVFCNSTFVDAMKFRMWRRLFAISTTTRLCGRVFILVQHFTFYVGPFMCVLNSILNAFRTRFHFNGLPNVSISGHWKYSMHIAHLTLSIKYIPSDDVVMARNRKLDFFMKLVKHHVMVASSTHQPLWPSLAAIQQHFIEYIKCWVDSQFTAFAKHVRCACNDIFFADWGMFPLSIMGFLHRYICKKYVCDLSGMCHRLWPIFAASHQVDFHFSHRRATAN